MEKKIHNIIAHYEKCLKEHGACSKGMDWPNEDDLQKRFDVMLGLIPESESKVSLLDLGCGVGLLIDYLKKSGRRGTFDYWGIDMSNKMIEIARNRHPGARFEQRDILLDPIPEQSMDFIIMNGVLTEKVDLTYAEMEKYAQALLKVVYSACKYGFAFNVMSHYVDWYRDDLFYWPCDKVMSFLVKNCSRNVIIHHAYGLYEYTVYVYRNVHI